MSVRLVRGALQASLKASSILRVLTPRSVPITRSFGLFSSNGKKEDEKESAHKELREAVRELSQGLARPTTSSSTSNLKDMDASPLSELEVDQLEELARAHYEGEVDGSEASVTKAVEIWTEAAERGSVESQYSLAICYREGNGIAKDANKAFKMMLELANKQPSGYHLAHYAVAVMFFENEGVEAAIGEAEREKQGFYHMKEAARKGVLPALYNIGNCFSAGRGVKQSDHNAQLYYSAAVEAGDPAAKFTLGTWLVQGRGGLPQDSDRAFTLQIEAAQAGHLPAAFNAGCHLMTGQGCEKDPEQAAFWFEKAAEGNIMQACVNLANMHREGLGVERDLTKARNLVARFAATDATCQQLMFKLDAEIAAEV